MSEPTVKEMTLYLQNAMELESSVYSQERAIREIDRQVRLMSEPTAKAKGKAPINQAEKMAKPVSTVINRVIESQKVAHYCGVFSFAVAAIGAVIPVFASFWWYGLFSFKGVSELCFVYYILPMFLLLGGYFFLVAKTQARMIKAEKEKYESALHDYEIKVQEAERQYAIEKAEYNAKVQAIKEEHEKELAVFNEKKSAVMNMSTQIAVPLADTKKILEQLYSVNWIFPKYRNLTAICTIYEYFAAGRCTELTGPNGAYNLYESELRQNRIIDRLDTIISELEEIKQNQYSLYTEIRKTNKILEGISQDVKCIMESTNQIAESTNVIQQCAMVTAQNTEALKYIALIQ